MQDYLHEVEASPVRWILGLERRRIARLRNMAYDSDDLLHDPGLIPAQLSKKRRDIWKYASGEVSDSYVHFLSYLDDLAELVRRGAGDETLYLERLKAHKNHVAPTTSQRQCLRLCDMLLIVAQAAVKLDPAMTTQALKELKTYLTWLVEDEVLSGEQPAHLRGPLPSHDSSHSYILESVSQSRIFCKNIAKRLKDRSVSSAADDVDRAAAHVVQSIQSRLQNQVDALKALQVDDDLVNKVIGPTPDGDFRAVALDLVGHERAHEYLRSLVDGSIMSLETLIKLQAR